MDGRPHVRCFIAASSTDRLGRIAPGQTKGVGRVTAFDPPGGILAASTSPFGGCHALAVDRACHGGGPVPRQLPPATHCSNLALFAITLAATVFS